MESNHRPWGYEPQEGVTAARNSSPGTLIKPGYDFDEAQQHLQNLWHYLCVTFLILRVSLMVRKWFVFKWAQRDLPPRPAYYEPSIQTAQ